MAQLPIDEAIVRFKDNEDKFDTFVNLDGTYTTNEVTPRAVQTLPSFMDEMVTRYHAYSIKGDWVTSTAYEVQDLVKESGTTYICLVAHTSGTFATDLSAGKWGVYQGVTVDDLASSASGKGAELVEYQDATVESALNARLPEIGTYALLRAYSGQVTAFYVRGVANVFDGGFGVFRVDSSDTTTADNGGTILVDAVGRRWKRVTNGVEANVIWFGADRTNTNPSASAVNSAIAYLNSLTGSVELYFPSGKYNLKAGVTQKITKDHFSVIGENTFITCESGNIFNFDNTIQMRRSSIRGFTFEYTYPTVSTTAVPIVGNKVLYMRIKEIRVMNAPAVFYLNDCSNLFIDDISGTTVNIATNALHFNSCAVVDMDNVSLITDAGLQPTNPATPFPNPPVAGNAFIRITGATNDTYRFGKGVLSNRYYRGLYVTVNTGESFINADFLSNVYDFAYSEGIFIENLGGSVANLRINDPYIQAMSGAGIRFNTTGGLTNNIWITRPYIGLSGTHGIRIASVGSVLTQNVNIDTPYIYGSNRLGGSGYDIYANYSRVNVRGGRVGINSLSFVGVSLQGLYGVYFDNCDQYSVTDVEIGGATATTAFTNNPASDYKARVVRDNRPAINHAPANALAYTTSVLDTVVSGDTYTNNSPYREYVSIYGATTSGSATIEVNGVQYSTRSEWSGILEPGDTLKVTTAITCNRRKTRMP